MDNAMLLVLGVLQISVGVISCYKTRVYDTYLSHPCRRPCHVNDSMNCFYDFNLELYFTMSKACFNCPFNMTDCFRLQCIPADGVARAVLVVNRMLPGPSIHVCEGDTVIVNVHNDITGGQGTSIHWHGILQHGSPHMDGVGLVTQCPIPIKSSFEYRFEAKYPGTHLWHAHTALHRSDGIFGAIVVRQPDEREPHLGLYENDLPEHTILINDWLDEMTEITFARHHYAGGENKPKSILINGKGVHRQFFYGKNDTRAYTPVEVFHVKRGHRYRFRTISNGILNCPKQVSIENHTLTMIASDGNPFSSVDVDSFSIFAGERYDFVLNASMSVNNYRIYVKGLADCDPHHAKQVAILHYEGASKGDESKLAFEWLKIDDNAEHVNTLMDAKVGRKILNPWNKKGDVHHVQVTELKTIVDRKEVTKALKAVPDKKFYLAMDFNDVSNYHFHPESLYPISAVDDSMRVYLPQINHVSLALPPSPPLTQYSDLNENMFCNYNTIGRTKNCSEEFCECVYRLQVDLNDVVELVMIDEGRRYNANHPMHLHGHRFHVVAMDKLGESTTLEEVKRIDEQGKILRNLKDSVAKDTVTVPDGGYTVLRFYADNPGFWFFHCHIEFHVETGMGLIIQVGGADNLPKVPKDFPKCGSWKFSEYKDENMVKHFERKASTSSVTSTYATIISIFLSMLAIMFVF